MKYDKKYVLRLSYIIRLTSKLGLTQVLRYNTGSAVRAFFGRQDQLWTLIHGQEGEWEAQGLS